MTPDRLSTLAPRRAGLAREFLDYYALSAQGFDVLAVWNDWAQVTFDPPLSQVEKDYLLWAVTHVAEGPKQGKIRVMLDKPPGQQFTHLHEESDPFRVPDADLERIAVGDLKREPEETWLSYVRRLAVGLGYMEDKPAHLAKPMPELRMPYKDPPDPIVPRTPDAYTVEVAAEPPYCGCGHRVGVHQEGRCWGTGCSCGSEAREEEDHGDVDGRAVGTGRDPVPGDVGRVVGGPAGARVGHPEAAPQEQVKENELDW